MYKIITEIIKHDYVFVLFLVFTYPKLYNLCILRPVFEISLENSRVGGPYGIVEENRKKPDYRHHNGYYYCINHQQICT